MEGSNNSNTDSNNLNSEGGNNEKLIEDMSKMLNMNGMTFNKKKKTNEEEMKTKVRKFWGTQPVPQFQGEEITESDLGPFDKDTDVEKEQKEPFNLPKGYIWYDIDINNSGDLNKLYEFLRDNYVEDDDHMFRFDYSKEFLHWHLTAPGYLKIWHAAILREDKKQIVGFISGTPVHMLIYKDEVAMVEINFLCVKTELRDKRLAAVLIKEITRRVHLQNIWQAVYTAGVLLPKPIATCTYYHRNLNIKKLLDVKFTYLSPNLNITRGKSVYNISKETTITGLRKMEKKDVEGVFKILNEYLSKFKVRSFYSQDEVEHWFLPRDKVVYSYVVENPENGELTDFLSFYSLPSSILNHEKHKTLYAAYSFFNVANSVTTKELMRNTLILASLDKFDVFNALNIMDNEKVFTDLLFGQGDGSLRYYFYNYACPELKPNELGIVLM
jgi:glycylpeptide N-tetradecanoyltransferase